MMKLIQSFLLTVLLVLPFYGTGQIKISELIQENASSLTDENKLYFVDFWATWCGPCIPAKKYLGSLQKQFPRDFYVISLSDESPDLVRNYIKKRPTNLSIAIDYDKETFAKHEINSLPTGILMDAKGRILWKGHPANLSPGDIASYLRRNSARTSVNEFIELKAYKKAVVKNETYTPGEDFELFTSESVSSILDVKDYPRYTSYEGNLKSILAYLYKVNDDQINMDAALAASGFKLNIMKDSRKHKNLVKHVLKKLKLKMNQDTAQGEVVVLTTDATRFWDSNQINWGPDTPKYLIGDDHIEANDVTFEDISYRLSNLIETPIIIENEVLDTNIHDWQIHYRFFELMQSDLADNFGIKASKSQRQYPVYNIQKKASY